MNCEEAIKLMDGYWDGELDPITNQAIEQHLRSCRNCEQAYETHGALVRAIGSAAPYYKAPAELRERIQSSLREEIAERPTRNVVRDVRQVFRRNQPELRTSLWGTPWNWLGLAGLGVAAAIIFAAIITLNLVPRLQRPGADQFLATQLIASHVRSLMANHLTDGQVAAVYERRLRNLKIKEGCLPKRPLSAVWRPSGLFPLQEHVSRRRSPLHRQTPTLSQESLFCPTSTIGTGIFAEQNGIDN